MLISMLIHCLFVHIGEIDEEEDVTKNQVVHILEAKSAKNQNAVSVS